MGAFFVTSIKFNSKEKRVFLKGGDRGDSCSKPFELDNVSKMWKEHGKEAAELEIMHEYAMCCLQGGNNKFNDTMKYLFTLGRRHKQTIEDGSYGRGHTYNMNLMQLMEEAKKAMNIKGRFVVRIDAIYGERYFLSGGSRTYKHTGNIQKAKAYKTEVDALYRMLDYPSLKPQVINLDAICKENAK